MNLFIIRILILLILLGLISCSSDNKTEQVAEKSTAVVEDTTYNSWISVQYKNITLLYPPLHPLESGMSDFAQVFKTVLRRNAQFFQMDEPTDSLLILFYTGFGQGQELANSEFPTTRGDTIFYWPGNRGGVPAAMYMLNKWTTIKESKSQFLFHGIMRLLDATGRDYHTMSFHFIDSGKFIDLKDLVTDSRTDYKWEAYQSTEAASFVDYFVFKYGINNFKLLYESQLPFDSTTKVICNMDLKALQSDWLKIVGDVVKQNKVKK